MHTPKVNSRPLAGHPYANARIKWVNGAAVESLQSYNTIVATCCPMNTESGVRPAVHLNGWYSVTTTKHIRWWLDGITRHYGLPAVPAGVLTHAANIAGYILWDTAAECWRCRKGEA